MPPAPTAKRNVLVFDVETVGDVTPQNRAAIAELAAAEEKTPEHYAALCPPLARVVCVAWHDLASGRLAAAFDATLSAGQPPLSVAVDPGGPTPGQVECLLHPCDGEARVLEQFGKVLDHQSQQANLQLVTYNGRGFDLPVLVHRAVKHGVRPGRAFLLRAARESRYNASAHVDLMDAVTFFGASRRFPMATYAIGYGYRSPKEEMDGSEVWPAVQAGRIVDVVRYCAGDVMATAHIYRTFHA